MEWKEYISLSELRSQINTRSVIWRNINSSFFSCNVLYYTFFFNICNWLICYLKLFYVIFANTNMFYKKKIYLFNKSFIYPRNKAIHNTILCYLKIQLLRFQHESTLNISCDVRQICWTHWLVISRGTSGYPRNFSWRPISSLWQTISTFDEFVVDDTWDISLISWCAREALLLDAKIILKEFICEERNYLCVRFISSFNRKRIRWFWHNFYYGIKEVIARKETIAQITSTRCNSR